MIGSLYCDRQSEDGASSVGRSSGLVSFTKPIASGSGMGKPTGRGQIEVRLLLIEVLAITHISSDTVFILLEF